ncbi:MAG: hypothetical protein PHZ11_06475 [Desulfitobacteriaceae bacterium]|nr:hypothetical protein [Desulfitobacteriaceae bacterium]MDD4346519.1 hypothetical protein [Desulfitobacteriaceae bacterium]MDD4402062.1 hypothetical protein [Desulfitobacteriaceae bacterium]
MDKMLSNRLPSETYWIYLVYTRTRLSQDDINLRLITRVYGAFQYVPSQSGLLWADRWLWGSLLTLIKQHYHYLQLKRRRKIIAKD